MGRRVLQFEILEELGRGGMGVVYKAFDTRLERVVALKFLSEAEGRSRLRPLIDEAIAASRLPAASVVTIHAEYESPEGPFLCMEYAAGGSLALRLRGGPLPLDEALAIGIAVARTFDAAHAAAILHCDLKPGNILLFPDGTAKVADFGLAQRVTDLPERRATAERSRPRTVVRDRSDDDPPTVTAPTRTVSNMEPGVVGTPDYMSPEQTRGERLDARSDLFALGVVLFEVATGRNAIQEARRSRSTLSAIVRSGRRLRPVFPPAYWRLVERLMADDRERRPKDATVALRVLERLRSSLASPRVEQLRPLFGRDDEIARLTSGLSCLLEGRGSAWLVEGRQGVGKTALVARLGADASALGALVLRGGCVDRDATGPYGPFLDALEGFIVGHAAGQDAESFLRSECGLAGEVAAFLGRVVAAPSRLIPPRTERTQLRDALRSLVHALARDWSVVLVLEDLHRADGGSADLFATWAEAASEIPLLLVGTHDPERPGAAQDVPSAFGSVRDRIVAEGAASTVSLAPLDYAATERLLSALLPVLPPGHSGFDQVFWRTRGLPAFIVEIARLAARSGTSLPAVERVLEGVMPESIRASLTLRLGPLDPGDLLLLRAAAVVGERFAPSMLARAGLADPGRLIERLQAMETEHQLIHREGDDRFRFDNPQVREFLLATMPPETQRDLHGRFADASLLGVRDTPPEVVAHHLLGAGRPAEAGRFLRAAAESALSVFAEEESLRFTDLAERNLPAGPGGNASRRDVLLLRARALKSLGRYSEALPHAEEAVRLARSVRAPGALGEALVLLGSLEDKLGDTSRAERTLRLAEARCLAGRNARGLARARISRGHLSYRRGRLSAAATLYRRAVDAARRGRDPVLIAWARANLANVHAVQEDYERAAEGYREALEFHRHCGDRHTAAEIEESVGLMRLHQGRLAEARALFDASLRTREEIGDRRGMASIELRLARCHLSLGEAAAARERAGRAAAIGELIGEQRLTQQAAILEVDGLLLSGNHARARTRLQALLEDPRALGETLWVQALQLMVRAHLARGDLRGAAVEARKARRIVGRIDHPVESRSVARTLARVLLRQGRRADALRLLRSEGSPPDPKRGRPADVTLERLESSVLLAAAARALSRRPGDAHDRCAREQTALTETLSAAIADAIPSPADRQRFLLHWRRERQQAERMARHSRRGT